MQIYIACALTHVPRNEFARYSSFIHRLAAACEAAGSHHCSYALINSDPQLAAKPIHERARLCYQWDREMVERADLVIAECSYPSIGLGIELQIALSASIPLILCFQRGSDHQATPIEYVNPDRDRHVLQIGEEYVSLMALGLPNVRQVIGYSTEDEGLGVIVDAVSDQE